MCWLDWPAEDPLAAMEINFYQDSGEDTLNFMAHWEKASDASSLAWPQLEHETVSYHNNEEEPTESITSGSEDDGDDDTSAEEPPTRSPDRVRRRKGPHPTLAACTAPCSARIGVRSRMPRQSPPRVESDRFKAEVVPTLAALLDALDSGVLQCVDDVLDILERQFPQWKERLNRDLVLHARVGISFGKETGRKGIDKRQLRKLPASAPKQTFNQLTDAQRYQIRTELRHESVTALAKRFGASRAAIYRELAKIKRST